MSTKYRVVQLASGNIGRKALRGIIEQLHVDLLVGRRRQAALGRLTPIEFEAVMTPAVHRAA